MTHTESAAPRPQMSPQARRRLLATMQPVELRDLAAEIAEALEAANPQGCVLGEAERAVIEHVLTVGPSGPIFPGTVTT